MLGRVHTNLTQMSKGVSSYRCCFKFGELLQVTTVNLVVMSTIAIVTLSTKQPAFEKVYSLYRDFITIANMNRDMILYTAGLPRLWSCSNIPISIRLGKPSAIAMGFHLNEGG